MIIKEKEFEYPRQGYITKYGNDNYNANEAKVISKYNNVNEGVLQDIDEYIRNINLFTDEIANNYYKALYDKEVIPELKNKLNRIEDALFKIAKLL